MSAFTMLADAIEGIIPDTWKLLRYEPLADYPDVTSVTMRVRKVSRLPGAPIGAYQVDWVVTVTTSMTSRESADPTLYDDLIDFLGDIDGIGSWLGWTEADKVLGDDEERLAYDITVRMITQKDEA